MKREELENIGLTKEQIDKVCDLNNADVQPLKNEVARLGSDLKAAQDAVAALENDQATTAEQLDAAKTALSTAQQAVNKAQADVNQAKKDIALAQGQISDIQDDIDGLTSRVSLAETAITQNSQAINLRATKTEVSTAIQGAKDYADSQITVKANQISQTVTQVSNKVNSLTSQKQERYYYLSTSETTCTGGSWSTTKPAETAGKYIWIKDKITYVDGSTSETSPVRMTGSPGAQGVSGKDAITIQITTTNGTVFKNTPIVTTLTAHVFKGGIELSAAQISAEGALKWYLNGSTTVVGTGATLSVNQPVSVATANYTVRLEG